MNPAEAPAVLLLLELGAELLVLFVVALALAIGWILGYIAGIMHTLPWPMSLLAGPINGLSKGITNIAYKAVHKSEQLLGASFHMLARYWDKLWNEIRSHAALLYGIIATISPLAAAILAIRRLVYAHAGAIDGLLPRVKTLEKEWKGIEHGIKDLTKLLLAFGGIDALIHLLKNLHGLRSWVKGQIGTIQGQVTDLAGKLTTLKNFLGIKNGLSYLEWAAGIVAAVIGVEILNLLKCPSLLNNAKNRGCSQWSALDDLLGLLALGIAASEFDTLVHKAQDLTEGAVTVFDDVFGIKR